MFRSTINSAFKVVTAAALAIGLASSGVAGAHASQALSKGFGQIQSSAIIQISAVSLANAKRAAQNYLKFMGFSRKGLIDQLVFEGYSKSIATKAVDSLKVNWNSQAVKVAKNYIKLMAFSRQGLIDQLRFDGFSASQAAAGAKGVGY